ncbi:MAG: hypothetical protein AAGA71_03020 [Pseudomonadota bacterium]
MTRRGRGSKGFAMAEALVALAVAALTLSLLTSASWGLKLAAERRDALEETAPADWLLARRTLLGWVANLNGAGLGAAHADMIGTASTMRMIVRDGGARPFVGEFRVVREDAGDFALIAARHNGLLDARAASDAPQESHILRTREPIRFLYLLPQPTTNAMVWRYETGNGEALPAAIGIETGNTRVLTVPLVATRSRTCLAALGPGGLEADECALR